MQQLHGGDIYTKAYDIDFSASLNPLGMPEGVAAAACEGVRLSDRYPDTQCRALRQALAKKSALPEDHIIFGNGAAELIYALVAAVKPRCAIVTAPGFSEYELALAGARCRVEHVLLAEENGFVLPDDLPDRITDETDIVFLCNPNNPTGVLIPETLLQEVARRCEHHRVLLVVDECFLGLTPDGLRRSLRKYTIDHRQLFILDAFTKLYAMPGLRLGFGLCADTGLLREMGRHLQPWNISLPAQMAGVAALQETAYVEESLRYLEVEKTFLRQSLADLGLPCPGSSANFLFFKGPDDLADALADRRILIRDCRSYAGLAGGWFRIGVRSHAENERLVRETGDILALRQDRENVD